MKKIFIVSVLIICFYANGSAQNTMQFKDGKTYKSTPIWEFICENYSFDTILKTQIAKTKTGGILKISIKTSNPTIKIGDKVLLILKNGNIIHCLDKNLNDTFETESIAYYLLSNSEMQQLKTQNLENIRFRILGKSSKFVSQIGHFTANNRDLDFSLEKNIKSKYDTTFEIKLLN